MAPKKKGQKMDIGEFLTNQDLGSWADEMDSQPMPSMGGSSSYGNRDRDGGERRAFTQPTWENARTGSGFGGGSGGGMGDRRASYDRPRYDREPMGMPTKPPYTAHLGNLTYEVTEADIRGFFEGVQVTNVRLVEDRVDQKPKGFGYVEFATVKDLETGLTFHDKNFMGRNIKVSVAEPQKERESNRDFSDWSRKGPLPDLPQNTRQPSRGFGRNLDNASDAGSEAGGNRRGFFEGDGKVRDFSDWSRKGPLSPVPGQGPPVRDGGRLRDAGPSRERRQSPAWGEGRSDAGSRPPRREFEPRPVVERAPTAAEQDNQWRARMKPDVSPAATPDVSTPSSPQQTQPQTQPLAPKERPRLNLQKRTVSTADNEPATGSATDAKASPFGAARPIDTAARDREVAEKREIAIRQKKEAEDKAKEDKVAREAASRAQRADRADRGQAQEDDRVTSPVSESGKGRRPSRQQNGTKPAAKENGEATPSNPKASFSILRRDDDEEGGPEAVTEEAVAGSENTNGSIPTPSEPTTTDIAKGINEGAPQQDTTSQAPEEDGWSTVAAKPKNNRRGGAGRGAGS